MQILLFNQQELGLVEEVSPSQCGETILKVPDNASIRIDTMN